MESVPSRETTPREVQWSDITEGNELDERVAAITVLFGSVIGVNQGYVSWCSDNFPPDESERLGWLWSCWPHLDEQIMPFVRQDLRDLMRAYRAGQLSQWWEERVRSAQG